MKKEKLYVVEKVLKELEASIIWEFQGVFDCKDNAEQECKDLNYFIGPIFLNDSIPEETTTWPGCYYPKAKRRINHGL